MRIASFGKIFKNPGFSLLPNLVLILLFLGVVSRFYLVFTLPIWHDEAFSIWASKASSLRILSGKVDPVHPPGYYLFLKLWSIFSDHLFWLRTSSILFFGANVYFLNKLGTKIKDPLFSLCLIFLYTFSGYFVIFDWQARMYTGVATLILASLFFLLNKNLLFFTVVNAIGLYFDYGFFWYFIPLSFFLLLQAMVKKDSYHRNFLFSVIASVAPFLIWLPFLLKYYKAGIKGIGWMGPYLSFSFFVPYFLGTHNNEIFTFSLFLIATLGFYVFWQENRQKDILRVVLFSALFSFVSTMLFSLLFSPIFHLRSLQIVGLAIVFLSALTIHWLYQKRRNYLVLIIVLLVLMNFFFTANLFFSKEKSRLLISFFPWKHLRAKIEKGNFNYVVFKRIKKLPTELLIWGLKYTLSGKESLPVKKIPYKEISSAPYTGKCELVSNSLLAIYGCK